MAPASDPKPRIRTLLTALDPDDPHTKKAKTDEQWAVCGGTDDQPIAWSEIPKVMSPTLHRIMQLGPSILRRTRGGSSSASQHNKVVFFDSSANSVVPSNTKALFHGIKDKHALGSFLGRTDGIASSTMA